MKTQTRKAITVSTLIKIQKDFTELRRKYPFTKVIQQNKYEIHYEVFAINIELLKKLDIDEDYLRDETYHKRIYLIVKNDYLTNGPIVYSLEDWPNLDKIPENNMHFYFNKLVNGRGYRTCSCVQIANRHMDNPLLENVKSTEMLLSAYELFLLGINDIVVLRQYSHGDKGVEEFLNEWQRD